MLNVSDFTFFHYENMGERKNHQHLALEHVFRRENFIGVCDINFSSARFPVLNIVKLLCIAPSCLADPFISIRAKNPAVDEKPARRRLVSIFRMALRSAAFPLFLSFPFLCFSAHRRFLTPRDTFSYLLIPLVRLSVNSIFFF